MLLRHSFLPFQITLFFHLLKSLKVYIIVQFDSNSYLKIDTADLLLSFESLIFFSEYLVRFGRSHAYCLLVYKHKL